MGLIRETLVHTNLHIKAYFAKQKNNNKKLLRIHERLQKPQIWS